MKLTKVEIRNFKCFNTLPFEFPQTNGFYLITGRNEENPAMGANGLGKSTLFDAITFAIYGKTARGMKAKELLNRNTKSKGYSVCLTFDNGGIIERSWNPNKLEVNGKEVDDVEAENFIGLSFEQFLYTTYFAQSSSHFIDLTPNAKLGFLSNVFELDKWLLYADKAKKKADDNKNKLTVLTESILSLEDAVPKLLDECKEIEESQKLWNAERELQINELSKSIETLTKEITDTEDVSELNALKKELDAEYEKISSSINDILVAKKNAEDKAVFMSKEVDKLALKINAFMDKAGGDCPQCLQVVPTEHVKSIAASMQTDLETKQAEVEILKAEAVIYSVLDLQDQRSKIGAEITDVQKLWAEASAAQRLVEKTKDQIKQLEKQIQNKTNETNPYTKQLDKTLQKVDQMVADLDAKTKVYNQEKSQGEVFTYWAKHFPLVRLSMLKEVTEELEIHFNEAFCRMGLSDYSISIETERELKNESIRKELNLQLTYKNQVINIDTLSGGERQRIKLATAVGISDLIKARLGVNFDLTLFDEPSIGLSEEGISSMLEMFSLLATNQIVFLAEHRVTGSGLFDKVYELIKEPSGNSYLK